jgi:GNAT superfamily N-acetyltransferase
VSVGVYRVRPATPAEAGAWPDQGHDRLWVAVAPEGGPPVGHLAARLVASGLLITRIAVEAAHRGRGVGATLLAAVLDEARWRFDPALLALACPATDRFFARHGFLAVRLDAGPERADEGLGNVLARRL